MAEQQISLNPGESKVVSFEATPQEARNFQVSVDGLAGSFEAKVSQPFDMSITDIKVVGATYATAYWTTDITAQVSNPNSRAVTRVLHLRFTRPGQYNEADLASWWVSNKHWQMPDKIAGVAWPVNLEVTLPAGGSAILYLPAIYWHGDTTWHSGYGDNMNLAKHGGVPIRYAFRIFDDLGNMSPSAYAGSYP